MNHTARVTRPLGEQPPFSPGDKLRFCHGETFAHDDVATHVRWYPWAMKQPAHAKHNPQWIVYTHLHPHGVSAAHFAKL
jgi:hypothetical protein